MQAVFVAAWAIALVTDTLKERLKHISSRSNIVERFSSQFFILVLRKAKWSSDGWSVTDGMTTFQTTETNVVLLVAQMGNCKGGYEIQHLH